jgi:hypothetical protein
MSTCHIVYENQSVMLYGAEVAVCSKINTKHINSVWAEYQFLSFKPVGASNQ